MAGGFAQCEKVVAEKVEEDWVFSFCNRKGLPEIDLQDKLTPIAHWMQCDEMFLEENGGFRVRMR